MGDCGVLEGGTSARPSPPSASLAPQPPADTASTSVTDTVNGSHHFKITGYSLLKGMGIGKYAASDTFSVGGYDWAVYFYPDGKSAEDAAAYVSLFVALVSEGTDVRALFELTLLDQSGKERHKIHTHFGRVLESGPYTLKYRGSMWGYKRFFRRTALDTSDYLKDDCLFVNCSVGVVRSHTEGPKVYTIDVPPSNIAQHFGHLLESGQETDVSLEVDGEIFTAHKLVLAARSPVFRAQLFGPMRDRNIQCIKVEDMEAPVFKALLHFIYWDSLPDMEELAGLNAKCASTLMAQHLLVAADRYALERLRLLCEVKLCEDVAINTVATTLALAEQHHCFQLKAVCLRSRSGSWSSHRTWKVADYQRYAYICRQLQLLDEVENVSPKLQKVMMCFAFKQQRTLLDEVENVSPKLQKVMMCFACKQQRTLYPVMQTDGFEYLKVSCPSILTELLEYVARVGENLVTLGVHANDALDDGDANGRRVKPRI